MMAESKKSYKYCIVPMCSSTTVRTPNKIFFRVPSDLKLRKKWCRLMKRDLIGAKSTHYVCEEHFDIENDIENYIQYKIMTLQEGKDIRLRLKKAVVPHIFECQKDFKHFRPRKRRLALKRRRRELLREARAKFQSDPTQCATQKKGESLESNIDRKIMSCTASSHMDKGDAEMINGQHSDPCNSSIKLSSNGIQVFDKAIQVENKVLHRDIAVNVNLTVGDNTKSLLPFSSPSKYTSGTLELDATHSIKREFPESLDLVSIKSELSADSEQDDCTSESSWYNLYDSDNEDKKYLMQSMDTTIKTEPE